LFGHRINSAIDARPAPPHHLNFSYLPFGHSKFVADAFDVHQDFFRPVLSEGKIGCGGMWIWGKAGVAAEMMNGSFCLLGFAEWVMQVAGYWFG
jgi:hypothetical protein